MKYYDQNIRELRISVSKAFVDYKMYFAVDLKATEPELVRGQ